MPLKLALALLLIANIAARDGGPAILPLAGDLEGVHDPAIIRAGSVYYVFSTNGPPGNLIPIRCSPDLRQWKLCGHVFDRLPEWATREIPRARAPWAPDVSYDRGKYRVYYSISTFGSNESAIGLATNGTLDSSRPDYRWVDEGMVVRSRKEDDFNAIDPNFAIDGHGQGWLVWGSFWGGIKMKRVDRDTGKPAEGDHTIYSLAARPRTSRAGGPIEAPFLFRHGGYWYLFVSIDFCCRGANSTYRVVVGRSREITGPFLDEKGMPMTDGGGSPVIASNTGSWRGPGHEAALHDGKRDYLVFHAYSAANGRSSLQISTLAWEKGWPRAGVLP